MNVHVIIVSYNGAAWLPQALNSLRKSIYRCTTIVVDNASTDGTIDLIEQQYPEAVLIKNENNLGFGVGNNVGINYSLKEGADAVFLLNQDAYTTPEAVGNLVKFLEEHPEFDIATPLHCSPNLQQIDPQTQSEYLQKYATGYISDACLSISKPYYEIRGVNAAAWFLRIDVFKRAGGFDPLFFMYGEDDDLITRFEYHRLRTALLPSARIVHLRVKSPRRHLTQWQRINFRSKRIRSEFLLIFKSPEGRLSGQILRFLAAGLVHPFGRLLADHNFSEFLAYALAFVRMTFEIGKARQHAKICARTGASFLNFQVHAIPEKD